MPNFEFECRECGHREEHVFTSTAHVVLPDCQHGAALVPMERVLSVPSRHQLAGEDGKVRRGNLISTKNVDYWNSRKGIEQYMDDKSGRPDLTQLENTSAPKR